MVQTNGHINLDTNSVLLILSFHRLGNSKKVKAGQVQVDADPTRIKSNKQLLESKEYDEIRKADAAFTDYKIGPRSMPTSIVLKDGVYRIPLNLVEELEAEIQKFLLERQALVDAFLQVYEARIEEARGPLGSLFNASDYKDRDEAQREFSVEYRYATLGVPESLSSTLFHREEERAKHLVQSEFEEVKLALRSSFAELVDHAADRLRTEVDDKGKPRKVIFRDSLIEKMENFMQYFNDRNIVHDGELAALVERARTVLRGVSPEDLRTNDQVRDSVQQSMAKIKQAITDGAMLRPTRRLVEN